MEIKVLASGSSGNCYWVSDGKTPLLIECGIPFKKIQEGLDFKLSEVKACLVSHSHQDHAKAVKDLMKAGIDCYASMGTWMAMGVGVDDNDGVLTWHEYKHRVRIIESRQPLNVGLGDWSILPFDVKHDAEEPLGFLLQSGNEKLLYATDTAYLKYKFKGLTRIMIEANYDADILRENVEKGSIPNAHKRRVLRSHFSLQRLEAFFKANDLSQVREIFLMHLSDGNSDEELFKRSVMEWTGKPVTIC